MKVNDANVILNKKIHVLEGALQVFFTFPHGFNWKEFSLVEYSGSCA